MKKTTKLFCFILAVSLLMSCLPAMGVSAAIGANGVYCDFDDIPLRALDADAVGSTYFTEAGLAFVYNPGGVIVEDRNGDGNRGLHLYNSASIGAALPTAVTKGKVKVTMAIYPKALATRVYLASSLGTSLTSSTCVQIGKFGNSFTLGESGAALAMTQNRYNRVELIVDLDKDTVDGYLNGQSIGTLTGLDINTAVGVVVGGNANVATATSNKPLVGDLGISTYTEDDTFSYVSVKDSVTDNVHTTTVMFDEPVDVAALPNASSVTIMPCTGGESFASANISAYGPVVELTWNGKVNAGDEYRIDFGTDFKSSYGRYLNDGAYFIEPLSVATMTLIDEKFDNLTTQPLNVKTGFNTATGIYLLGGDENKVLSDVVGNDMSIAALSFSLYHTGKYNAPRYIKMPHSDPLYPYSAADPYTATDGNYAAVPYTADCSRTFGDGKYYRLGDLTQTSLGGMPKTGIIRWSFDYLWEYGSGSSANTSSSLYLKWVANNSTDFNNFTRFSLKPKQNNTNTWTNVIVEYDADEKKVRTVKNDGSLSEWEDLDMSSCSWLALPAELSVQRLAFAIDNVKVTWTQNPLYIEGVRYVASNGSVTGANSIQAETNEINIYFSSAVTSDIASHITLNGSVATDYTLSSDGKMMTVNTGFFKGNSTVTLAIDSSAESAAGNRLDEAKTYTLKTGAGRFAVENLNATVNAKTPGIISSDDKINVTADIINTLGEDDGCTLIFAYYTDGGKTLVDVGFYNVDLTDIYRKHADHDFTPKAVNKAYDTVKVFAWNSLTGAMPLVNHLTK